MERIGTRGLTLCLKSFGSYRRTIQATTALHKVRFSDGAVSPFAGSSRRRRFDVLGAHSLESVPSIYGGNLNFVSSRDCRTGDAEPTKRRVIL
jgi:hypothetical protein